jgi:hypothetical protein
MNPIFKNAIAGLMFLSLGAGCKTTSPTNAQLLDDNKLQAGASQTSIAGYYHLSSINRQIEQISSQKDLLLHIDGSDKTGWILTVSEIGETSQGREDSFEMKKPANQPKCPGCMRFEDHQLSATILTDAKKRTISFGADGRSAYYLMVPALGFKPSDLTSIYGCYSASLKLGSNNQDAMIKTLSQASEICIRLKGSEDKFVFSFINAAGKSKELIFDDLKAAEGCRRSDDCFLFEGQSTASKPRIRLDLKPLERQETGKLSLSLGDDQLVFAVENSESTRSLQK